jgi:DNA-binding transcriptional ArsR family regulator
MSTSRRTAGDDEVRAIRALAHPLRLRLLDLLRFDGPSTATLLAGRLGESSGATSYHLRLLARYGYVEEEPRAGHLERWWRYRERPVALPAASTDDQGARGLLAEVLGREAHALDRYLVERGRFPHWDDVAFFRTVAVRLTLAEFEQLRAALMALLESLRRADGDGDGDADADADADAMPGDTLPVRILVFGFPQILEES